MKPDDKVIECKEFEDSIRGHSDQVMTDTARRVGQLADLQLALSSN